MFQSNLNVLYSCLLENQIPSIKLFLIRKIFVFFPFNFWNGEISFLKEKKNWGRGKKNGEGNYNVGNQTFTNKVEVQVVHELRINSFIFFIIIEVFLN